MNASHTLLSRQGQRLLQIGVVLFLYSSVFGFAIPFLGSPRIGLSVHTLSALQGVVLLAQGLLWPRLNSLSLRHGPRSGAASMRPLPSWLPTPSPLFWGSATRQ